MEDISRSAASFEVRLDALEETRRALSLLLPLIKSEKDAFVFAETVVSGMVVWVKRMFAKFTPKDYKQERNVFSGRAALEVQIILQFFYQRSVATSQVPARASYSCDEYMIHMVS